MVIVRDKVKRSKSSNILTLTCDVVSDPEVKNIMSHDKFSRFIEHRLSFFFFKSILCKMLRDLRGRAQELLPLLSHVMEIPVRRRLIESSEGFE